MAAPGSWCQQGRSPWAVPEGPVRPPKVRWGFLSPFTTREFGSNSQTLGQGVWPHRALATPCAGGRHFWCVQSENVSVPRCDQPCFFSGWRAVRMLVCEKLFEDTKWLERLLLRRDAWRRKAKSPRESTVCIALMLHQHDPSTCESCAMKWEVTSSFHLCFPSKQFSSWSLQSPPPAYG